MLEIYADTATAVCVLKAVEEAHLSAQHQHHYTVVLQVMVSVLRYLEIAAALYVISVQAHG